jgi:Fe-S-cluster containining protein
MARRDRLFLSLAQARKAICIDLRHYHPQVFLCTQILPLIAEDRVAKADGLKNGAWVGSAAQRHLRWLPGPELVESVCRALGEARLSPDRWAAICSRVFQTRAVPHADPDTGGEGVWLETGMEGFACRQCGRCCRTLEYRHEATPEDIARWREMRRSDILEWVGVFTGVDGHPAYRLWTIPGTARPAAQCPFLHKAPSRSRWACRIHDLKPAVCRQYPFSRKHATMTGCPAFEERRRPGAAGTGGRRLPGARPRVDRYPAKV